MLWLHLHFPRLALEARFITETRAIPQLLLEPSNQKVMQCNDLACQLGVQIGMNKKTAFCLLSDCAIAEYDSNMEQQSLQQLALLCYRLAAQISPIEPQGLLLEISSMLSLHKGLINYIQQLKQQLSLSAFSVQMSTGPTPECARVLAESGIEMCSERQEDHKQALCKLSTEQLNLPIKITQALRAMGIHNYQQLKNLPRKELGYRFGAEFIEQLDQLEKSNQPPAGFKLPERFQQSVHLSYDAEHARGLIFPLRRVLMNLETYLYARQLACEKLLIKLQHRDGRASLISIASVKGSYRQIDWLSLLSTRFEHCQLIAPVTSLTVHAKDFIALENQSQDILGNHHNPANKDRLQSLLLARLGEAQVKTLKAEADPRPEMTSQLQSSHLSTTGYLSREWPSLLLPEPRPIQIDHYQIIAGPERIEGGWWDAAPTRRDYYVATNTRATNTRAPSKELSKYWIYRRDDGRWFLHGVFS